MYVHTPTLHSEKHHTYIVSKYTWQHTCIHNTLIATQHAYVCMATHLYLQQHTIHMHTWPYTCTHSKILCTCCYECKCVAMHMHTYAWCVAMSTVCCHGVCCYECKCIVMYTYAWCVHVLLWMQVCCHAYIHHAMYTLQYTCTHSNTHHAYVYMTTHLYS